MADWVELSVLASGPAEVSRDVVGETLDQAGLLGLQDGGLPPFDVDWLDDDAFNADDASGRYAEDLWRELDERSRVMGSGYPFVIDRSMARLHAESWREVAGYAMLLLLDHGRSYSGVAVQVSSDTDEGRLFEKVVEAAATSVLGRAAVRFGWPREPGWPTSIEDRIHVLGAALGLDVENLSGKTTPADKDKGLDVAGCHWLGTSSAGTAWYLIQCAVGKNWRNKSGEPPIADWQDILRWGGPLVKAIAVPYRLSGLWDIDRTARKFGAVVFDRYRLCRSRPDDHLDAATRTAIVDWCADRFDELPTLS